MASNVSSDSAASVHYGIGGLPGTSCWYCPHGDDTAERRDVGAVIPSAVGHNGSQAPGLPEVSGKGRGRRIPHIYRGRDDEKTGRKTFRWRTPLRRVDRTRGK